MDSNGTGGRVGGTQFDDKVIDGITSIDWKPLIRHVTDCDICGKAFLPERYDEHVDTVHND